MTEQGRSVPIEAVTREDMARALQLAWDDFCGDTGDFPDCFEWRGGNGRLYANFDRGNFAGHAAGWLIHNLKFKADSSEVAPPTRCLARKDIWWCLRLAGHKGSHAALGMPPGNKTTTLNEWNALEVYQWEPGS